MPIRSYQSILQLLTYYIHIIHVRNLDPFSKKTWSQQSNVTFPLRVTNSEERKAALELYRTMSDLGMSRIGTGPKICSTDKVAMSTNKNMCFYLFLIFFEWKNEHPDWPTSAPSWDHPRISLIPGTSNQLYHGVTTPSIIVTSHITPNNQRYPTLRDFAQGHDFQAARSVPVVT